MTNPNKDLIREFLTFMKKQEYELLTCYNWEFWPLKDKDLNRFLTQFLKEQKEKENNG